MFNFSERKTLKEKHLFRVFRNRVLSRKFGPEVERITRQRVGRKYVKEYNLGEYSIYYIVYLLLAHPVLHDLYVQRTLLTLLRGSN